jgi:hypothetical protein
VFSVECGVFSDIPPAASTIFKALKLVGSLCSFSLPSPVDLPAMAWRFPVVVGGGRVLEERRRCPERPRISGGEDFPFNGG